MRRKKGEGTVFRRPNGAWRGCVELPRHPETGKRRRLYVSGSTKGEVQRHMEAIQNRHRSAAGKEE